MGKRPRGAALRAKKRARETLDEMQEQQAERATSQAVRSKTNEELFVVDTTAAASVALLQPAVQIKKSHKKPRSGLTAAEQAQVDHLIQQYGNDADQLADVARVGKEQMQKQLQGKRVRTRGMRGSTKATFDLWNDDSNNKSASKPAASLASTTLLLTTTKTNPSQAATAAAAPTSFSSGIGSTLAGTAPPHVVTKAAKVSGTDKRHMVAVDVAKAGQSYHPDPISHQAVLKEAVDVELSRQKASQHKEAPLSRGLSSETRALLVGDTDSEDDGDDGDNNNKSSNMNPAAAVVDGTNDNSSSLAVGPLPTRADKKTRAQRNKEKRLRQQEAIYRKRKTAKKLVNEISEVHRYAKEFKRQDVQQRERKSQIANIKNAARPLGTNLIQKLVQQDPIQAPTVPVVLPSELSGNNNKKAVVVSLRTVQPKGSLASERLVSLHDRNLVPKPTRNPSHFRGKRRKKAVKGSKNNQGVGADFVIKG